VLCLAYSGWVEIEVRPARWSELTLMEGVFVASARAGWRSVFGKQRLSGLVSDGLPEWGMNGVSVVVAVVDSDVVGFASFGPANGEGTAESWGNVYRLFVHPDWWRHGVGDRLLAAAVDALRMASFAEAVLWVWEENASVRRFYERRGWRADGARTSRTFLGIDVEQIRYRLRLTV